MLYNVRIDSLSSGGTWLLAAGLLISVLLLLLQRDNT